MRLQDLFAEFPRRDWDTDPDGTVRLAVVGLGGFARNVSIPAIAEADYATLGAVVSGSPEVAETVATEHDATAMGYEAYAEGRHRDAFDAVYVATPNRLHLPHVRTAADQGKAVIAEKPLDATPERAAEAVAACEEAGVPLMTAYRMQADPVFRRLREFVSEGGIGEPVKLAGDFTFPVLGGSRGPDQWRLDADLAGGGALMDVGVYPLNTARFLLEADPVAVAATTSGDDGAFAEVDEHVHALVSFPEDVVGRFTASFSGHSNASFVIHGTGGRVRVDDAFQPGADRRVTVERDGRTVEFEGLGVNETCEEFDYFAHCVLTGTRPEPDGQDGLVDMRVMAAIYDAADEGRTVDLTGSLRES